MNDLIYSKNGNFTSVREPYIHDNFVGANYKDVGEASSAIARFSGFLKGKPFLDTVLNGLKRRDALPIKIIDIGVFMGIFTVAISLKAKAAGIPCEVKAYEANSALVEPIRSNLELFGVTAEVFANGVGGKHGVMQFVHATHGLIGGSVSNPKGTMAHPDGYVSSECRIVPLAEIIAEEMTPGLVKIDIEGHEVVAFGSIAEDQARLNNVFIVEFAPYQAGHAFGVADYGAFLLERFDIYDVSNWLWVPHVRRLSTREQLDTCLAVNTNRSFNTDLVLVPKSMRNLSEILTGMVTLA